VKKKDYFLKHFRALQEIPRSLFRYFQEKEIRSLEGVFFERIFVCRFSVFSCLEPLTTSVFVS